jgi:hypothetical protein
VAIAAAYELITGRTFTFKVDLQHRSATTGAGSTWANFGTTGRTFSVTNSTTASGAATQVVAQQCFEGEGVFRKAKRFIRFRIAPSVANYVSTTATEVGTEFRFKGGVFIFGGADALPASG